MRAGDVQVDQAGVQREKPGDLDTAAVANWVVAEVQGGDRGMVLWCRMADEEETVTFNIYYGHYCIYTQGFFQLVRI